MDRKEFINSVKDGSLKGYADYGILPSLTIAQAILESAWGSSQLAVRAKNLFGVKVFSNWRRDKVNLPTASFFQRKGMNQLGNALTIEWPAEGFMNAVMPQTLAMLKNS